MSSTRTKRSRGNKLPEWNQVTRRERKKQEGQKSPPTYERERNKSKNGRSRLRLQTYHISVIWEVLTNILVTFVWYGQASVDL